MHCNLVKNDSQHTSKTHVLFTFVPNKKFGQLIIISPHSLTLMNTVNTEFSSVEVSFTDQFSKAREIEDNVSLTRHCVNVKMRYSTERKYRKYVKRFGFLSFSRKFVDKYGKKLVYAATKLEKILQKQLSKE